MDRIDEILSLYEGDVVEMKDGGRIGYKDKGFVKGSGPKTGSALDADVNTKKVKLPESLDDYASGGIARMLGE